MWVPMIGTGEKSYAQDCSKTINSRTTSRRCLPGRLLDPFERMSSD